MSGRTDQDGPVPVELDGGFRTDLPPATNPRPVSPGPTRLTADQIIRAEALASAARAHPNSDPEWILGKAAKYARWIRYGGGDQ